MTTYQVRDPAVDNAEDGWTTIEGKHGFTWACKQFRIMRQLRDGHPLEVMHRGAVYLYPSGRLKGYEPPRELPKPPPKPPKFRCTRGSGQKGKDVATILKEVAQRPGMTGEELMAEVFGPEVMPLFKEMLAFRGTLFGMNREGQLKNKDGRYFPKESA